MSPSTDWQLDVLVIVTRTSATVGFIGAIGVLYILFSDKRELSKAASRLVLAVAITDIVEAVKSFISRSGPDTGDDSVLCQAQAMMDTFSALMDPFLCCIMTCVILYLIYFKGQVDQIARIEHFAIGGCTIFALAVSVVPSFTTPRLYGSGTMWCWITSKYAQWQLYLAYSVIWAVMVFNFVAYVFTGHTMNAISRSVTASSSCGATSSHSISTRPTSYLPDGKLPNYYDNPHVRPRADSTPAMYDRPSQLAVPQPTHNHNRLSSASTLINVPTVQCQEYRAPCDLKRSPTASGSGSSSTRNPRSSILRRMRFYVVAFLLIWLPGSVNRVYGQVSGGGKYTFALSVAQVVMQPSRGMANLVAYLLNLWYAGSFWRSMARVFGRRGGVEM